MPEPKVLFLTHSLGTGGSERVTVSLAEYFSEQGCSVKLLPLQDETDQYPVSPKVTVDRGMPQGSHPLIRGYRKLRYVIATIGDFEPDVVLSLGAGFGYLSVSSLRHRFRLVTSVRNDPVFLIKGHPGRRLAYWFAFARSSKVVFQSRGAAEHFGRSVRDKAVCIDNPLRDGLTHNDSPFAERDKEIVYFGRLVPQKRLDVLIQAFADFHKICPAHRLTIFGRGPERESVIDLAIELGVSAYVSVEPFRSDIHSRIARACMYVSTSDVEGVSNSMLEAMALGLPAVCTDCPPGGTREIIERFGTGLLATVADPTDVARQMATLAASPQLADTMITAGRQLRTELASENIGREWLSMIHSLIETTATDQVVPRMDDL